MNVIILLRIHSSTDKLFSTAQRLHESCYNIRTGLEYKLIIVIRALLYT
jgi:hypothetical protein